MFVYPIVRDLREDSDKMQKQIAELLNMQLTVYQRYERGERASFVGGNKACRLL